MQIFIQVSVGKKASLGDSRRGDIKSNTVVAAHGMYRHIKV